MEPAEDGRLAGVFLLREGAELLSDNFTHLRNIGECSP